MPVQGGGIGCPADGVVQIALFDLLGETVVPAGSGPIVRWTATLSSSTPPGDYPLAVQVTAAADGPAPVPLIETNGLLEISQQQLLDIPTLSGAGLVLLLMLLAAASVLALRQGRVFLVVLLALGAGAYATPATAQTLDVDGSGDATVAADLTFIARHLLDLPPVPPEARQADPSLPPDSAIAVDVDAVRSLLDVDADGEVLVNTDLVYIARRLEGALPLVPARFRALDPTIAPDNEIAARIDVLLAAIVKIGDQTVRLGRTLHLDLTPLAPAGGPVSFSAAPLPLPANSSLSIGGLFTFRPREDQLGTFPLTFTARAGALLAAETVAITVLGPEPGGVTALSGRVLDSNDFARGVETPVVGATVSFLGTGLVTTSGADGSFSLQGAPTTEEILDFDTSTAIPAPDGSVYAGFRERIRLLGGVDNVIDRPFFLPRIDAGSVTPVDPNATTTVENSTIGVGIVVPPATARNQDGSLFTGSLSISPVVPALTPGALPQDLGPALVVTIQPVGVTFATPVPITFPNVDDLEPGTEVNIWSLDPETGDFAVVGIGRVSADGQRIETISGGVRAADWHFPSPAPPDATDETDDTSSDNEDPQKEADCALGSSAGLQGGCLSVDHTTPSYRALGADRALRFVYRSTSAHPFPVINAETTLGSQTAVPQAISGEIVEVGGLQQEFKTFSEATRDRIRHAVAFDASDFPTGRYPYEIRLTSHYAQSTVSSTLRDFVLVSNEVESPFGAGWTLDGLQRLSGRPNEDAVTLTEGDGAVKVFIPQGATGAAATDVVFVMDGSGSISGPDFQLQLEGMASAIEDPLIVPQDGSVAIAVVQFAGFSGTLEVALTLVDSQATGASLAAAIRAIPQRGGGTPLAEGVNAAVGALVAQRPDARQVLCVSTDGQPNSPSAALQAAEDAVIAGVDEISAAGIGPAADLDFLATFVRNGSVFAVGTFEEFARSIGQKLQVIIGGRPAGEFSAVSRNADGTFTRRMKDGTEIQFDADGRQTAIVDRSGNTTTFGYDTGGRLVELEDPVGKVTTLSYGADGRLEELEDPAGRVTRFEHDAEGNLVRILDADGSERAFTYDDDHLLIAQTDQRGNVTGYAYDETGRLAESVLPDGTTRGLEDSRSLALAAVPGSSKDAPVPAVMADEVVSSLRDGRGELIRFRTDKFGAVTERTDPLGRVFSSERDGDGLPTRVVEPNGAVTEMLFDTRGNLLAVREASGTALERETLFEYEPQFNQVTKIVDPAGVETEIEYDAAGNPLRVIDPAGNELVRTYDARGLVLTSEDENGHVTTFTYDSAGNLESLTDAEGSVTRFTRDAAGNVTAVTEGDGALAERTSTLTYDGLNRLLSTTDGTGATTTFTYDAAGNSLSTRSSTGETVTRTYDALNRLVEVEDPIAGTTRFAHDGNGNVVEVTDALGRKTQFTYDESNQLTSTLDALSNEQEQAYDANGNLLSFTDANGNATRFEYDLLDRRVLATDALGRETAFAYDERDNLVQTVDSKGQVIDHTYDLLSRLTEIDTPDNTISLAYDAVGNPLTVIDDDSSLSFTYDDVDRLLTAATGAGGVQPLVTLTATYDVLGNRTALADSLGGTTGYTWDAADRLVRLVTPPGAAIDLSYDTAGRPTGIDFPNGASMTSSYDGSGRLTSIEHARSAVTLARFEYTYNLLGNVLSVDDGPGPDFAFTYDELQRLTSGGTAPAPETYGYDPEGNRVSSHLSGFHDHDAANQLLEDDQFLYTYDANGNLETRTAKVGGGVTTYSYDAQDQLVRIDFPDISVATYRYDGLGRRIEKTVAGAVTRYVYDGEDIALELDGTDALVARFSHGDRTDQPLAQTRGGQSFYYHADHQGSIRRLTNVAGVVVNEYQYDAYGQLTVSVEGVPNPYTYTAREQDPESGLLHYRARTYDPRTGRFLQRDPLGLAAGDANLYGYVFSNPVNLTDPDGQLVLAAFLPYVLNAGGAVLINGLINSFLGCDFFDNAPGAALAGGLPLGQLLRFVGRVPGVQSILSRLGTSAGRGWSEFRGILGRGLSRIRDALRPRGQSTVIGKVNDLQNLRSGENTLLKHLSNQGSPKTNWAQNSSVLRQEMAKGRPIRDASVNPNGTLRDNTGFLRAERNLLETRGWTYDPANQLWSPP